MLERPSGESERGEGNIIISPFSIFTGLSLLHLGTAGETRDSFQSALHFPAGQHDIVHQDARKIVNNLEKLSRDADQTFILQTSNAAFLDTDFTITENYRFLLARLFTSLVIPCLSSPGPRWNVTTRVTSPPSLSVPILQSPLKRSTLGSS